MGSSNTFPCPVCGEDVSHKAKVCPHCGACEKSGWGDTDSDGLDLPWQDDDFHYYKFVEKEFGTPRPDVKPGWPLVWKTTAIVLVIVLVIGSLAGFLLLH